MFRGSPFPASIASLHCKSGWMPLTGHFTHRVSNDEVPAFSSLIVDSFRASPSTPFATRLLGHPRLQLLIECGWLHFCPTHRRWEQTLPVAPRQRLLVALE